MPHAFGAALVKDARLLGRDRVGLVFLTLAPIVVITVAGLSLANLYDPGGTAGRGFVLPLVDEDRGSVGRAIAEGLGAADAVDVRPLATRAAAQALVRRKAAGAALVVPAGTSAALAEGRPAALDLLTDPVKSVELASVRTIVLELRHRLERAARDRAAADLERAGADAVAARDALRRAVADLERKLEALAGRLEAARAAGRADARRARAALAAALAREAGARRAEAESRLATTLLPLRQFLTDLDARRREFALWLEDVHARAGRFAERVPPPPEPPPLPAAVAELAASDPAALAARLVPGDGPPPRLPALPAPPPVELPAIALPELPVPPMPRLPGMLAVEETSVTGAPWQLNTFDQNVPGFGITFLLLGVLLGVSLGLLDEREWGTLDRLRSTPASLSGLLLAKLLVRGGVGIAQMALLFLVGRLAFGVSLGPQPWALALPTVGIVLAGTAFGLVVAGLSPTREAVLPVGSIVILTMAAVGGCWWPIDLEPPWMRTAALALPTTWAMDAYNDLMIRGRPGAAVLRATAVLLGHAGVYLAVGLVLVRRRLLRAP